MKLLGLEDKIVDCFNLESTNSPVFTYSLEHSDYLCAQFLMWDRFDGDVYRFVLNDKFAFDIGAGLYIFAGCQSGAVDWLTVDEMLGRDINVFTMHPDVSKWDLLKQRLVDVKTSAWYLPQTKHPFPIVSNCGSRIIMASTIDQHRGSGANRDLFSEFVL